MTGKRRQRLLSCTATLTTPVDYTDDQNIRVITKLVKLGLVKTIEEALVDVLNNADHDAFEDVFIRVSED